MGLAASNPESVLAFFDGASIAINHHKQWVYLSPAWEQLTGFAVADTLGQSVNNDLLFGSCPTFQGMVEDLLSGKYENASHEMLIWTATGAARYVEILLATQTRDSKREVIGIIRDVTKRKQAEDALVRSEQRTQQIVNLMPCMVARLSRNLRVTFANTAYAAHFGKRLDEVIGASLFDLLHPSQRAQARDHLASLSRHNPRYVFESWVVRPDGETRFQRWTDHVFFDEQGHIRGYQTVGVDLTANKLAENQLRHSENKFRALVENMADIVCTVDLDGNFTYLPPSWETVTGHPIDTFLGISGMPLVHPADVDAILTHMRELFSGEQRQSKESIFYRVEHADGQWHWHAGRSAPIVDEEGNVTGAVAVVRDVTGAREHQLLLQDSLDQLERTLNEKTMLMKEIHHRVKNNLQIVASLLSIQSGKLNDPHAKDALAASRDRVIAMAKIHHMMYEEDSGDEVVFSAYLASLLERIQHAYGLMDITFDVVGDNLTLPADHAVPMGLIVNELLTNAVKYAFPEPQADAHVTIRLTEEQTNITMTVEDNGVGLSPDVDPLASDSLGMTIVQSLTTQLNGTVTFTNRDDTQGLHVKVWIPKQTP